MFGIWMEIQCLGGSEKNAIKITKCTGLGLWFLQRDWTPILLQKQPAFKFCRGLKPNSNYLSLPDRSSVLQSENKGPHPFWLPNCWGWLYRDLALHLSMSRTSQRIPSQKLKKQRGCLTFRPISMNVHSCFHPEKYWKASRICRSVGPSIIV